MYKDNGDVTISCNNFEYKDFNGKSFLTDHNASLAKFTLHKNVIKDEKLTVQKNSLLTKAVKIVKAVSKTLSLLIKGK